MRDDIGNTNKLIFGGTSNQKSVGPLQDKTVYRDDYVGHEADPNTVYVVNPFMETTLPKPKHRIDKTIYMGDYVPKKVSSKKCPIYDMPPVPQELRNEGGHIYFDADWEQWHNQNKDKERTRPSTKGWSFSDKKQTSYNR